MRILIVTTSCPQCGQDALKVIRRAVPAPLPGANEKFHEECHACLLKKESRSSHKYLINQWRILWHQAGGQTIDLPACLRLPSDPLSHQPQVAPRIGRPIGTTPGKTPPGSVASWARRSTVLPPLPPLVERPRVLFVSHNLERQGSPRILLNLLPHLRSMTVELATLQDGPLRDDFLAQGIPVVEKIEPKQYDLIVCNTVATHPAVRLCHDAGVAPVWLLHEKEPAPFLTDPAFREISAWAKRIVLPHTSVLPNWATRTSTACSVIPAVIPPVIAANKDAARQRLSLPSQSFIALTFGSDEPRKGQTDLWSAVIDTGIDVHCVRNDPRWRDWLSAADVYVCTSRWEGYPLSIMEAKACRVPVIATRIPVHADMLTHEENGLLYPPGEVKELRYQLLKLRDNPALRYQLAKKPINGPTFADSLRGYETMLHAEAGSGAAIAEPPHVVYHICGLGDHWKEVVREQFNLLKQHGLCRLLVTHCGEGLDWICQTGRDMDLDLIVCFTSPLLTVYERPAIELIERLAKGSDRPVLYLHSKGVSHPGAESWWSEWRRLMQEELVPRWRQIVPQLETFDAAGVCWWTSTDHEHFSGNFWLASARWLRRLPPIGKYWRDRFSAERWIGSVPGCNALSLLCQDAAFWDRDRGLLHELRREQKARQGIMGMA